MLAFALTSIALFGCSKSEESIKLPDNYLAIHHDLSGQYKCGEGKKIINFFSDTKTFVQYDYMEHPDNKGKWMLMAASFGVYDKEANYFTSHIRFMIIHTPRKAKRVDHETPVVVFRIADDTSDQTLKFHRHSVRESNGKIIIDKPPVKNRKTPDWVCEKTGDVDPEIKELGLKMPTHEFNWTKEAATLPRPSSIIDVLD